MKKIKFIVLFIITITAQTIHAKTNRDSTSKPEKQYTPYIIAMGGLSIPLGQYGGNTGYTPGYSLFSYTGYAGSGNSYSLTGGVDMESGWGLIGMISYDRHPLGTLGFLNENADIDITGYFASQYSIEVSTITGYGNYYYTDYSYLIGLGKSWKGRYFSFGLNFMAGELTVTMPPMNSILNNMYYWDINSNTTNKFALDAGMHFDVKITSHIFTTLRANFLYSVTEYTQSYTIKALNGTTLTTYAIGGEPPFNVTNSCTVGILNVNLGIGYKF